MPPNETIPTRPFIVLTATGRTDVETRKRIRRYVMRGKNRGKNQYGEPRHLRSLERVTHDVTIPPKVGSDLSFTRFPDEVEPQAAFEAIKVIASIVRAKYVIANCLIFPTDPRDIIEQLSADCLVLQSVILMAQAHFDFVGGYTRSYPSQKHLKTVHLLREKISLGHVESQVSDHIIFAVTALATYARIHGEDESARHHLHGIRRIVDLRGGLSNITQTKLKMEILRFDIDMAIHTGSAPLLCDRRLYLERHFPYPERIDVRSEMRSLPGDVDAELAQAWTAMKNFLLLVDLLMKAKGKITWNLFSNAMASLVYRLLHMSFDAMSVDEAIRLALLALSSHVFLQGTLLRLPYTHLTTTYKDCLIRLDILRRTPPRLFSWLLMVGAVSIFDSNDAWLIQQLKASIGICGLASWKEMHDTLNSFMWAQILDSRVDVFLQISGFSTELPRTISSQNARIGI